MYGAYPFKPLYNPYCGGSRARRLLVNVLAGGKVINGPNSFPGDFTESQPDIYRSSVDMLYIFFDGSSRYIL